MKAPFEFLNERKKEIDRIVKEEFDIQNRNTVPDWNDIPESSESIFIKGFKKKNDVWGED